MVRRLIAETPPITGIYLHFLNAEGTPPGDKTLVFYDIDSLPDFIICLAWLSNWQKSISFIVLTNATNLFAQPFYLLAISVPAQSSVSIGPYRSLVKRIFLERAVVG